MNQRGRPPATRNRVLTYWEKHGPCSIRQICNATGSNRQGVYRALKSIGIDFCYNFHRGDFGYLQSSMNGLAYDSYLVGGSSRKGTSDALDQRRAIRQMCSYCQDDAKIASYHQVSANLVAQVRAAIPKAKRKGAERSTVSHDASGADVQNPFVSETRMNDMIRRGSDALLAAIMQARAMAA